MIHIDSVLLNATIEKAKVSPRKRMNHNFHTEANDTFQRMLNCIEPETYCQPHKHENPVKREVFIILKGTVAVLQFDNNGKISDYIILNQVAGRFGVEIPHSTYHTIIALEPGTVVYECKDGPYLPLSDKEFAPWAPAEGSSVALDYNKKLLKEIGLLK
jgi:cupin fold WbuC family metalloprotein